MESEDISSTTKLDETATTTETADIEPEVDALDSTASVMETDVTSTQAPIGESASTDSVLWHGVILERERFYLLIAKNIIFVPIYKYLFPCPRPLPQECQIINSEWSERVGQLHR